MPDKVYNRRNFFSKVANTADKEDELFNKYSRKEIGDKRVYEPYESFLERADGKDGATENTAARVGSITSGLAPYTGVWTDWEKMYLLKRTGFGNKKADLDAISSMSVGAAVDAITTINATPTLPSSAPLNYNQVAVEDPIIGLGQDWTANNLPYTTASASNDGNVNSQRFNSLSYWHWGLWLNDGYSIREKMVQFWYHFIPINYSEIGNLVRNSGTLCSDYYKLLRENALGNFKTLIKAIAKSPAMLIYLSNHYSTASAPNENFARELLELFMLGKQPTQNYTELDVQSGAKVLSGWRVASFTNPYPFVVNFVPGNHNQTTKTFSNNFNNTSILNIPGAGGSGEFETYFDMLFQYQSDTIARYICRRIYRYFVYYDIDANIESNVIVPLATALISNNWELLPTMRLLLKSEHFFDMANRGVMIKSPFDFIAGMLNTLNVSTTPVATSTTQVLDQYKIWENFNNHAKNNMGQGFCLIPNVSGWNAYYQAPSYYQNWINANNIQKRAALITSLIAGYTVSGKTIRIEGIEFLQQFPNSFVELPNNVVNLFVKYLLPLDLPQSFKDEMKVQSLLTGQTTDSYWTTAWNNFVANSSTANRNVVNNKLKALLTSILQLAEFQLM